MKARYAVRIGREDVGRRVTVRSRIPARPGEPSATDTVGILRRWDEHTLAIELRDGTVRTLRTGDLLAARVVGAPPAGGARGRH